MKQNLFVNKLSFFWRENVVEFAQFPLTNFWPKNSKWFPLNSSSQSFVNSILCKISQETISEQTLVQIPCKIYQIFSLHPDEVKIFEAIILSLQNFGFRKFLHKMQIYEHNYKTFPSHGELCSIYLKLPLIDNSRQIQLLSKDNPSPFSFW